MSQYIDAKQFDDAGVLQTTVAAPSSANYIGGWAVTDAGVVHIEDLGASAVPDTAYFRDAIALDASDGTVYCTSDAPSSAEFIGGKAVRADGALHVSTSAAQEFLGGWGVRSDGAVCVSAIV